VPINKREGGHSRSDGPCYQSGTKAQKTVARRLAKAVYVLQNRDHASGIKEKKKKKKATARANNKKDHGDELTEGRYGSVRAPSKGGHGRLVTGWRDRSNLRKKREEEVISRPQVQKNF